MGRTLSDVIEGHLSTVFMNTEHFAVEITYKREEKSVDLVAIVEPSIFENMTELGVTTIQTRGYLIEASTLILNGVLTLPKVGDTITEGDNTYIVPKGQSNARYEYDDPGRTILRVNTTLKTGT